MQCAVVLVRSGSSSTSQFRRLQRDVRRVGGSSLCSGLSFGMASHRREMKQKELRRRRKGAGENSWSRKKMEPRQRATRGPVREAGEPRLLSTGPTVSCGLGLVVVYRSCSTTRRQPGTPDGFRADVNDPAIAWPVYCNRDVGLPATTLDRLSGKTPQFHVIQQPLSVGEPDGVGRAPSSHDRSGRTRARRAGAIAVSENVRCRARESRCPSAKQTAGVKRRGGEV